MRWAWIIVAAGCGISDVGTEVTTDGGAPFDAGMLDVTKLPDATSDVSLDVGSNGDVTSDAPSAPCDLAKPFASATNLGANVNTGNDESGPALTADELTLFYMHDTGGGRVALFTAMRSTPTASFGPGVQVSTISDGTTFDMAPYEVDPFNTLYFVSVRDYASHFHPYSATGDGANANDWSNISQLSYLTSYDPYDDISITWCAASSEAWLSSNRYGSNAGSFDLYVSPSVSWFPSAVTGLDTPYNEINATLSKDGLTLYFGRDDSAMSFHVWTATRASVTGSFGTPSEVADFDSATSSNAPGWLSTDSCRMYFTSNRAGGQGGSDIWVATRAP